MAGYETHYRQKNMDYIVQATGGKGWRGTLEQKKDDKLQQGNES